MMKRAFYENCISLSMWQERGNRHVNIDMCQQRDLWYGLLKKYLFRIWLTVWNLMSNFNSPIYPSCTHYDTQFSSNCFRFGKMLAILLSRYWNVSILFMNCSRGGAQKILWKPEEGHRYECVQSPHCAVQHTSQFTFNVEQCRHDWLQILINAFIRRDEDIITYALT